MLRGILYLVICTIIGVGSAYSQCTPNTSITTSGITPDSATGLAVGTVGQLYNQVLQIKVPVDTTVTIVIPITVPINYIQLISFTGLPSALSYSCNPTNCTFPGGSNGCVLITGTPDTAGVFIPVAITKTNYTVFGATNDRFDTISYYRITINPSNVGLNQHTASNKFLLEQNTPNPFSDFTIINYAIPAKANVEFKMFNIIGKEVLHDVKLADAGKNNFTFDGRDFAPGIYMYSMTFNNETITKRLVISRK